MHRDGRSHLSQSLARPFAPIIHGMACGRRGIHAACLLVCASLSQARVAYDNFLPDGSFFRIGWSVVQSPLPTQLAIEQAESFAAWDSGTASRLVVAMGHGHGMQSVVVELHADRSGEIGPRVGAACRIATNDGSLGLPQAAVAADLAGLGWHFKAGRRYWLLVRGGRSSSHAWQLNLAGATGFRCVRDSREAAPHYAFGTQGTFRISLAPYSGVFG
jgi:hypothetical protein